jgi:TonB family protein
MAAGVVSAADFAGLWTGSIETDGNRVPVYVTFNQQDGKITGTVATGADDRQAPMEKLDVDGDKLAFEVRDDAGRAVQFRLTLTASGLNGESAMGARTSKVALSRGPDPGVHRIGRGITGPQLIRKVDPEYSEEGRKAKFEGTVILNVEIDPDGVPQNIEVRRSVGLGLDEKAVEAVRQWRFKPGLKGGLPVPAQVTIEVNFRLRNRL